MMNVSVPSASALSDLASLAEILKLLSDKKEMGALLGDLKLKMEALKEKETFLNSYSQELEAKSKGLSEAEAGIELAKAQAAKILSSAESQKLEAESKMAEAGELGGKISAEKSAFSEYEKHKLSEIKAAEERIASDLGKAKKLYDEGLALKSEYEDKVAKLKQAVG